MSHRHAATMSLVAAITLAPQLWAEPSTTVTPQLRARCLSILYEGLASDEFWPSMHAAEALTQAGHGDEVLRALKGRLDTEEDDQHRCGLAREQIRAGRTGLAHVMLDILANKESTGRTHAAESLYKVKQTGDGKLLRAALDEGEPVLELMAAAALVRGGDTALLARIRAHLGSHDERAPRIAVWVLGRLGDETDCPALRKLLQAKPEPLTACYVVNALAQLGARGAVAEVAKNLKSDDAAVRTYSAQTLGDCRAKEYLPALVPLLDDENLDTRLRAAQAIILIETPRKSWR